MWLAYAASFAFDREYIVRGLKVRMQYYSAWKAWLPENKTRVVLVLLSICQDWIYNDV